MARLVSQSKNIKSSSCRQGNGSTLDINLDQPGKVANTSWSSDFQVAAPIDAAENTWYVFMRIPYASLI